MRIFEKILCPIDFSENSVRALQWTQALAHRFQSSVIALHVMEYPVTTDSFAFDLEAYQERTKADLREFLEPLDVPHESIIIGGTAAHEIVRVAEAHNVTLIVMGTRGLKGATHHILGSTTESVIHHAGVPVFSMCPDCCIPAAGFEKRNALIPANSPELPPPGHETFKQILNEMQDAVTVVHVVSLNDPIFGLNFYVHPFNVTAYDAGEKEKQMCDTATQWLPAGQKVNSVIHFGKPAEEIVREASTGKYDLIFMGVKKEKLLQRFLDSTTYKVISGSCIPVITVKVE